MSKIMEIKYVNSAGTTIILNTGNYLVSTNNLRDFKWEYTATNRPSGFGGRVMFSRPIQEKKISLGIRGATSEQFDANATALQAITELDIRQNTPGQLYVGRQYLTCYLSTSSAINYHSRRGNWVSKEVSIVVTEPFWHTATSQRFLLGAPETVQNAKRYNGRNLYRYIASTSSGVVVNPHYTDCPMIITIYGEAIAPSITIGGNIYSLSASISAGERIIINQLTRTIVSMAPDGTITNLFEYRDKLNDIFKPMEAGSNVVIYTGAFTFDLTVIQQRSEPSWI